MDRERDRGDRMRDRIGRTLEREGVPPEDIPEILRAHDRAMAHRRRLLVDDHHPGFLHPGRTLLVAVTDGGVRDRELLAQAPLLDSLHPERVPVAGDALALHAPCDPLPRLPLPLDASVSLEALVLLPPEAIALGLAEALDQLRHLHLDPDATRRARVATLAGSRVVPLAGRLGGAMDRRIRWWWRRVGRGMS